LLHPISSKPFVKTSGLGKLISILKRGIESVSFIDEESFDFSAALAARNSLQIEPCNRGNEKVYNYSFKSIPLLINSVKNSLSLLKKTFSSDLTNFKILAYVDNINACFEDHFSTRFATKMNSLIKLKVANRLPFFSVSFTKEGRV
jgi:hypothetical protein